MKLNKSALLTIIIFIVVMASVQAAGLTKQKGTIDVNLEQKCILTPKNGFYSGKGT